MLRLFGPDCPAAPVDAASLSAIPSGAIWVDLLNPTHEEESLAEALLGQNIPTREELAEIEPSSRLYERQGALFMTASVVHGIRDDKPDNDAVGFILTDRVLITLRYVDPKPFVVFSEHLYAEPELASDAITVLDRLLDTIVDRLADELEETARQIESVSAQIFEKQARSGRARRKAATRLEALLLRLGGVQRLLSELRESAVSTGRLLGFLSAADLAGVGEAQRHLESLQGDVKGLLAHADFLADNLAFLLNASLGLINLEQNFVMKIFSVFAVVLMPPTLIAGIYGMNFEHMPELRWLLGYPLALALIMASAVLPYWLARRSGWL
ncbi:MAG TPA: magnesium transporter CorA family protein [Sphingomicrobium sp.]|nr:magnesium transporter CorA family protein [Sphingomicrobium sp.]